jgi:hypothetical protein
MKGIIYVGPKTKQKKALQFKLLNYLYMIIGPGITKINPDRSFATWIPFS